MKIMFRAGNLKTLKKGLVFKMKYTKDFLKRGMAFGGFGSIIGGIVFLTLHFTLPDFSLSGYEAFLAIVSTYVLAFLQAGASVFNQIEEWPLQKSLFWHFLTIYVAYIGVYLINAWIPFELSFVLIFTAIFVVTSFAIWLTVYFLVKRQSHELNEKL